MFEISTYIMTLIYIFRWTGRLTTLSRNCLVAKMLVWICQRIILTIISSFFYCTETNFSSSMVVYFRKRDWNTMQDTMLNNLENTKHLAKLNIFESNIISKKLPRIRFIPKANGMRPIYPIKHAGLSDEEITNAKVYLSFCSKIFNGVATTVEPLNRLADIWEKYVTKLRNFGLYHQNLYFVKVDITDAFGSIKRERLFDILKQCSLRFEENATVRVYAAKSSGVKCKIGKHNILFDKDGRTTESMDYHGVLMVASGHTFTLSIPKVIDTITNYCKGQMLRAGRNTIYDIIEGVAQGGILSMALCELYYRAFAYSCFNILSSTDLLLHSVDDFLFVSPDEESAKKFRELSLKGSAQYNVIMNSSKLVDNLGKTTDTAIRVPFCGSIICSESKQVLVAAGSIACFPAKYSMTICQSNNSPKEFLIIKLKQVTLARANINVLNRSYTTVSGCLTNVYRIGIMSGARMEALLETLPDLQLTTFDFIDILKQVGRVLWARIRFIWKLESSAPLKTEVLSYFISE